MPKDNTGNRLAMLDELIEAEKGLLQLSQAIHDDIRREIELISKQIKEAGDDQDKTKTAFEKFDQKSNQLFNILSTVMKSIKEMNNGVSRNLL